MVTKAEPRKRPGKVSGRWQFQCNEDKRTSRSTGSYFFKVFLLVSAVWAYIDSSSSISCIDDHHTITVLVTWEYYYFDLNCLHTFIAPAGSAFQTEKCKLASPSVTSERRGQEQALVLQLDASLCYASSHPFGRNNKVNMRFYWIP